VKATTLPRRTFNPDTAPRLLDHASDKIQAQPSALGLSLRRRPTNERLENAFPVFRRNPRPVVRHPKHVVVPPRTDGDLILTSLLVKTAQGLADKISNPPGSWRGLAPPAGGLWGQPQPNGAPPGVKPKARQQVVKPHRHIDPPRPTAVMGRQHLLQKVG